MKGDNSLVNIEVEDLKMRSRGDVTTFNTFLDERMQKLRVYMTTTDPRKCASGNIFNQLSRTNVRG